jgi:hypothetical protein
MVGWQAFATVKRGEWMGIPVAIKSINKLKKGQYARGVQRELQMWWYELESCCIIGLSSTSSEAQPGH